MWRALAVTGFVLSWASAAQAETPASKLPPVPSLRLEFTSNEDGAVLLDQRLHDRVYYPRCAAPCVLNIDANVHRFAVRSELGVFEIDGSLAFRTSARLDAQVRSHSLSRTLGVLLIVGALPAGIGIASLGGISCDEDEYSRCYGTDPRITVALGSVVLLGMVGGGVALTMVKDRVVLSVTPSSAARVVAVD
jgi:hypothetical protein